MKASYKDDDSLLSWLSTDEGLKIQYPSISILAEIILTFPASEGSALSVHLDGTRIGMSRVCRLCILKCPDSSYA